MNTGSQCFSFSLKNLPNQRNDLCLASFPKSIFWNNANQPTLQHPTPPNYSTKTKKIIKEYGKVLIASKDSNGEHLIYKTTNLCFHNMMLLVHLGLCVESVEKYWQN